MTETHLAVVAIIALMLGAITAKLPMRKRWDGMAGIFMLMFLTFLCCAYCFIYGSIKNGFIFWEEYYLFFSSLCHYLPRHVSDISLAG